MQKWLFQISMLMLILFAFSTPVVHAEQKGKPVCGHSDPSKYRDYTNIHGGAGTMKLMELLSSNLFETNLIYFHRGTLPPKSGIGEHLHRTMEEMYFIFNAPAEFTVNGHTALLPAGSTVLCPLGYSHGIYNNSDITLEWLNIGVTMAGKAGAIDYGDSLTAQTIESPAPFAWAKFDSSLLKPMKGAHDGKGTLLFRRLWGDESCMTNWAWIDHVLLPPDTSIGYHQHNAIEEVYYVMSGTGRMTVNDTTWDVGPGDATPCTLHDSHGIYNNTDKDLEIFVLAVAMEKGKTNVNNWGDDLSGR